MGRFAHIFFVPTGQISSDLYWKAAIGLLGGLTVFSVLGFATLPDPVLFMILTAYPVACLTAKRLRLSGRPGAHALLPLAVPVAHFLLIGLFSVLTVGGFGAGTGGGPVTRPIYRALEGLAEPHVYMILYLGWVGWIGRLPAKAHPA